jgi:outer membrane lipoprotein carrier protein
MKLILTTVTLFLFAHSADAQSGISRAIAAMSGQQATFVQKFTPRGFKNEQVESGVVIFGPSPKMRWTYSKPEQKVFVFDGTTSWFYVPSDRQVTVNQLTDEERRALPFLLLADGRAVDGSYTVKESSRGGSTTTRLTARETGAMVREIVVTTSRDNRVTSLQYTDRQGNRTVFEFSNFARAPASEAQFTFQAPAGVQVLRQ